MYFDSSHFSEKEKVSDDHIYCVSLIYSDNDFEDYVGAIRLGISKNRIEEILNQSSVIANCSGAVFSRSGDNIASVGKQDASIENTYRAVFEKPEAGVRTFSNDGENFIVAKRAVSLSDWFLIDVLPLNSLLGSYYTAIRRMIAISLLLFILIILLFNKTLVLYTKRLNLLVNTMIKYREGTPELIKENTIHDDIGQCIDAYNLMAANITRMFDEQMRNREKLHSYNMQILYERVNPHFLYNTLEIINNMAMENGVECISETVQKLAEYYRISLNNSDNLLTLEREIRHSELYIDICNQRFSKSIDFCCEISDELLEIKIPKMLFQPIIENSVRHGFLKKGNDEDNEIIIAAYVRSEYIDIELTDNGVGISAEELESMRKDEYVSAGIGLRSTNERIKLYYGEACGISVQSVPGEYTTVTLRIKKENSSYQEQLI